MQPQLPTQQTGKPIPIGRIAVSIAVILFFIGLALFISTAQEVPPPENAFSDRPPTTAITKADRVPGQVVVKFKDGVTGEQITNRLKPLNASIKDTIDGVNATVINVPPGQEKAVLKELSNDPLVKYAEPDYVYYLQFTPNDPQFGQQWDLHNTGQTVDGKQGAVDADIRAEQAWDVTKGAGIKVAVLDSGIDLTHPEFSGKIVASQAFASSSIIDIIGHGTHVAGIISATGNNGQGITGVCPECQLLIGKLTTDDTSGIVPSSVIAPSIIWAADNGAKVINMSLSGPDFSQTVQDAIDQAWSKNAVLVAAAGNNSSANKSYPGAYDHVIAVANTKSDDTISATSNFGSWVAVAAPGDTIFSTLPTTPNMKGATNYGFSSGTSMATPVVSGIAALIWSTKFGTNNAAVVERLISTADKIPGTGSQWTYGRVNAANAVSTTSETPTLPPLPTSTPLPTLTPTPTLLPTEVPSPTLTPEPSTDLVIVPTFVCGGSTESVCPTLPPNYPQNTIAPELPTEIPPAGDTYPTGETAPTVAALPVGEITPTSTASSGGEVTTIFGELQLPTFDPTSIKGCKHHKKHVGGIGHFVQFIVGYLVALIKLLLMKLGVH
jgi:thermitase